MAQHKLPQVKLKLLCDAIGKVFNNQAEWSAHLQTIGLTKTSQVRTATEGAVLGSVLAHGVAADLGIISDGAFQFKLLSHGLCWVHAERTINKLIAFTSEQRQAIELVQEQIWQFYRDLKAYKSLSLDQQAEQRAFLEAQFDQIFTKKTNFETLNQALRRLHKRKAELLLVLEKPDLPLHNNSSERDIREYVTRRKISGGTRSESGRLCRDTFASLKKTCRKLGISFWEYLTDRVCGKNTIPPLAELICRKARSLDELALSS